eukprot:GABV01001196.1.p1 GENE.GABV01001196.1~~GABV01001196.1.p1  ORF type:complete len:198 (+),score=46.23 GABV01001196.1:191-784(+)
MSRRFLSLFKVHEKQSGKVDSFDAAFAFRPNIHSKALRSASLNVFFIPTSMNLQVPSASTSSTKHGRPCSPSKNIFDSFLPQLLQDPNASDPLNSDAAHLYTHNRPAYEEKVRAYVARYCMSSEADRTRTTSAGAASEATSASSSSSSSNAVATTTSSSSSSSPAAAAPVTGPLAVDGGAEDSDVEDFSDLDDEGAL